MTVAQRLYVLIAVAVTGLLLIAGMGYYQTGKVFEAANFANVNTVPSLKVLHDVSLSFGRVRVRVYRHVLFDDNASMAAVEPLIAEAQAEVRKGFAEYEKSMIADAQDRRLMEQAKAATEAYFNSVEPVLVLSRAHKSAEATVQLSKNVALAEQANTLLDAHVAYNIALGESGAKEAEAAYSLSVKLAIVLAVLVAVILLVTGLRITRNLMRQLGGEPDFAAELANKIARGDLSTRIELRAGDSSSLLASMQRMSVAITALVTDANKLAQAGVAGQLSTRADASRHQGDFQKIVVGVNDTLDAVIGPLNVAANYVQRIAKGDIPQKITDDYNGDFNIIKINLNTCIDAVNALVADAEKLAQAAVKGELQTRADANQHEGDFKQIVLGVNNTLDAIVAPVNEVVRVLGALAQGDMTQTISADYRGTFAQLKDDANATVAQLTQTISRIKEAANTISAASKEIASGNTNLSQRTEEQASSLEETAASMEELTSTVKQNADNAKQANQLALSASEIAVKGGAVVGQVVGTMSSISESSKKIVDIISVIDGIAFQTNILALNAAVEAARAGEQGRGFAVVATEVRNLAQRSAAAAKEIKELISDSVDKVGAGTRLVDDAGKTMNEVVGSVKRVTDIMAEITAASAEQSQGIGQINTAITQMDDVTQQNAALVEEAAAAAESMEEQARELAVLMASFKLSGEANFSAAAASRQTASSGLITLSRATVQHAGKAAPGEHRAATRTSTSRMPLPKPAESDDGDWKEF